MHCIRVYVCQNPTMEFRHLELGRCFHWHIEDEHNEFVVYPKTAKLMELLKAEGTKMKHVFEKVAFCSTNYFGGAGDQSAKAWIDGKKIFDAEDQLSSIDEALQKISVVRVGDKDEFDTVELGRYRSMDEFEEKETGGKEIIDFVFGPE